jgi:hypothetical protein
MVDLTEAFARRAIHYARKGDWDPLIKYLENPNLKITGEVRKLLTLIVKGELKRPKHRVATAQKAQRYIAMVERFSQLKEKGASTKIAVMDVAKEFNVSAQTVFNARREYLDVWNRRSDI